jgi:hypothetical protein
MTLTSRANAARQAQPVDREDVVDLPRLAAVAHDCPHRVALRVRAERAARAGEPDVSSTLGREAASPEVERYIYSIHNTHSLTQQLLTRVSTRRYTLPGVIRRQRL